MKTSPQGAFELRSRARRRALQAIYQWQVTGEAESADYLVKQFKAIQDFRKVDESYFTALVHGVVDGAVEIDGALGDFIDRPLDEVDHIERAILRLAGFELKHQSEVPALVVLDEAIELAHSFGAEQGHSYVNGVLDKAAQTWRAAELGAR